MGVIIKRDEQKYVKVLKIHKLVCDKCGSEDNLIDINKNGFKHKPVSIKCNNCDSKSEYFSVEDYNALIKNLTEVEYIKIEELEGLIK